jgi:hypothetical protein
MKRALALLVLAVCGLVIVACKGDPWAGWEHPAGCSPDTTPYSCMERIAAPDGSGRCPRGWVVVCVSARGNPASGNDANAQAEYLAKAVYGPPAAGYVVLNVNCYLGSVPGVTPNTRPLDDPQCISVVPDGGACYQIADPCTVDSDCCSGICSEQNACEACRAALEGCTGGAECCSGICSLNACGGNGPHRPPPGGV